MDPAGAAAQAASAASTGAAAVAEAQAAALPEAATTAVLNAVTAAASPALGASAAAGAALTAAAASTTSGSAHIWGLLLALAAAAGNNIGKGLQKAATRGLPALSLARKEILFAYLSSPVWLCGLLLDVAGGGAMLAALAAAPVSLVQPVAAFGLVLLAGFSHFVLQERLSLQQWQGAAIATCGIVGMGISSSSSTTTSSTSAPQQPQLQPPETKAPSAAAAVAPSPYRVLFWFLLLLSCLGIEVLQRQRQLAAAAARRRRLGPAAVAADGSSGSSREAAVCGLEAGCCFGFSAAAARTGFQLSSQLGLVWLFAPLGIGASLCLTSSGLVLQTQGFKHGSALVVCTTAAAASIVAGVVMGLLALAEPLPPTRGMRLLLLCSWAAVALGVISMSGSITAASSSSSSSGHQQQHGSSNSLLTSLQQRLNQAAKALVLLLPRAVRRRLPRRVLQWLGRGANVPGGLGFGVFLRRVIWGGGSRATASGSGDALSLRFYDEAAVAEVMQGLGFSARGSDAGLAGAPQQGFAAGDRVLRSTSLGLSDDGGPGLPVSDNTGVAPGAAAAAGLAAVHDSGVRPYGGSSGSSSGQQAIRPPMPDFGGVLAPMGGRRV